jgi:hypothetical protein
MNMDPERQNEILEYTKLTQDENLQAINRT